MAAALVAACAAPAPPAGPTPAAVPPPAAVVPAAPLAVASPAPGPDPERWTGLGLEPLTEARAQAAGLPRAEGLLVVAVEAGSPAARAGLRAGDVVLLAGGTYAGTPAVLERALAAAPVGTHVEVVARRAGELLTLRLPAEPSPPGRLLARIPLPSPGILAVAAHRSTLWGYGQVPGGADRGIVPIPVPGGPPPLAGPRAVASPGAERVIAADDERIYLGWAGSELYLDYYELGTGRVGRLPVRGAEALAHRCRPQGLARVGSELWMACRRPEGPVVVRVDLGTGQARLEPLPAGYRTGLAFDGEAVLWLGEEGGQPVLSRTDVASGAARSFPLPEPARGVAADAGAVYLLGPAHVSRYKPWR